MSKKIKEVILHKAMKDINFTREELSELPSKLFDETEAMKAIYTVLKRAGFTSGNISAESLAIKLEEFMTKNKSSEDTITEALAYMDSLYQVKVDDNDESLNSEVDRYIKTELSKEALTKFIIEGKHENADNLSELVQKLKEIEVRDINGTGGEFIDFFEDIENKKKQLSTIVENKFSTGFKTLDAEIEGGIARGELGLVIAPTGRGKSLTASNLARNYVRSGLNVLYVALEEKMDRMVLRAEQQMLGVSKSALMGDNMQLNETIFDALQAKYKEKRHEFGNYFISKHMPQQVTPNQLEQIIVNTTIKKNVHIDVVIIDYPQLMRNPYLKHHSEHDASGKLFEEIRRLAQQYQFVCWTLAQTNRTAYSADIITSEHVEGSRKILNAVEVAIAVNQKDIEYKNGYLRFYLDKVRNGSGTGNKFVHIRVEPEKMRMRDELYGELSEHKQLLSEMTTSTENTGKFREEKSKSKIEQGSSSFGGLNM